MSKVVKTNVSLFLIFQVPLDESSNDATVLENVRKRLFETLVPDEGRLEVSTKLYNLFILHKSPSSLYELSLMSHTYS